MALLSACFALLPDEVRISHSQITKEHVLLYREKFPKGSLVRVKGRAALESFKQEWHFHNPLTDSQLAFAGKETKVDSVGFYHGGDVLYTLEELPGVWHEQCLESAI